MALATMNLYKKPLQQQMAFNSLISLVHLIHLDLIKMPRNRWQIETVTLSTFCSEQRINRIDLLKMDIEGSKYEVIEKDLKFIKGHFVKLMFEYHNNTIDDCDEILIKALEPYFSISIRNPYKGGGMLFATNRLLIK
jgi:hypothetical protein